MIITCPACKTQANIPESKAGAKVRCGDCGRVYVGRKTGAPRKSDDPTQYIVIGGVVVLALGLFWWVNNSSQSSVVKAQPEEERKEVIVDSTGWDSPLVKIGRTLHTLASNNSEVGILNKIDGESIYHRLNADPDWAPEEETFSPPPLAAGIDQWIIVDASTKQSFQRDAVQRIFHEEEGELVRDWEPYDGWVVFNGDDHAAIRLKLAHRVDAEEEDRHIEWRFTKRGPEWKAWSWERWFSPEEVKAERVRRSRRTTKKTLSDGSLVIEADVRILDHLEDTPIEVRNEIDTLVPQLLDIDSHPRLRTTARERLYEIGKPAVPALLSQFAIIPLETEEQAMKLQQAHLLLQEMTGYITTFNVHDAMGGTLERRESGAKQWFGWYERKWKKYTGPIPRGADAEMSLEDDPFLDLEPRNEAERREFEKLKREAALKKAQSGG